MVWNIWVIRQAKFDAIKYFIDNNVPEVKSVFFPTVNKEFKRGAKIVKKRVALYSGYLFLKYDDPDYKVYQKLRSNPFITTYVGQCSTLPVDDMVKKEEWNTLNKKVAVGDTVEVITGPFKDFKGDVFSINGNKVTLKVDLFGREVEASFVSDDLEILEK